MIPIARTATINSARPLLLSASTLVSPTFMGLRQYSVQTSNPVRKESSAEKHIPVSTPPYISSKESQATYEDWVLHHPTYTQEQLQSVKVLVHPTPKASDRFVANLVKFFRWGTNVVTGYKHATAKDFDNLALMKNKNVQDLTVKELRSAKLIMTPQQWLVRILFLESIAGVPGSVAAILRHLKSLRSMKRDGGWIKKLLEEAENERMHLLTFMKIGEPSLFFRFMVMGAQGVVFNALFFSYMIAPRVVHRFVGKLEEEAVRTYSFCIEEMKAGHLPEWDNMQAPDIAKEYWKMSDDASMLDLMYAVRLDEAGHRFVNHSLANLETDDRFNPFALKEPDAKIIGSKIALTSEESQEWYKQAQLEASHEKQKH